jgi:hypothetical protein
VGRKLKQVYNLEVSAMSDFGLKIGIEVDGWLKLPVVALPKD